MNHSLARWTSVLALFVGLGLPITAAAAPNLPSDETLAQVPESLRPWVPWVLAGQEGLACPQADGTRRCLWPSTLRLDLGSETGSFDLQVTAFDEGSLPLPGDATHFPVEVRIDGAPATFVPGGGAPLVRLTAGTHRIEGRFRWPRLPETLAVPSEIARVTLRVDGAEVPFPRREGDGAVWIASTAVDPGAEDALAIDVHRRIDDGVPVRVTTRLSLRVSGQPRELALEGLLLAGTLPVSLDSVLPVQLDASGRLVVQLRPGEWTLELATRSTGPITELAAPRLDAPWPAEEYWAVAEAPAVRAVRIEAASPIDPQRTSLPEEWRALPAFRVEGGGVIKLVELRRGESEPPPDMLRVRRTFWLAEDGGGLLVQDQIAGELFRGGRIDLVGAGTLGRATVDGEGRLLTEHGGAVGIEVRKGALQLETVAALAREGDLHAVGWNRDAAQLGGQLHLPPGWTLLAAPGVDRASGSWLERWTLWDLFLALLVTLSTAKVAGRGWGAAMALLLALAWHEPGAPRFIWLAVVVAAVLHERLKGPRITPVLRVFRVATLLLAAAIAFLFARTQIRTGLHPQLGSGGGDFGGYGGGFAAPASPMMLDEQAIAASEAGAAVDIPVQSAAPMDSSSEGYRFEKKAAQKGGLWTRRASQVDAKAVVQTGPGLPRWSWKSHELSWNGAVAQEHTFAFVLLSPTVGAVLALVRALGFLLLLVRLRPVSEPEPEVEDSAPLPSGLTIAVVAGALLSVPGIASAQANPSPELLEELRQRLTVGPPCAGSCIEVSSIELDASGSELVVRAEVSAAAAAPWTLPGPDAAWLPHVVTVDGQPARALRRGEGGFLSLLLDDGAHRVELRGPARDSVVLQFREPPRQLRWVGEGWAVEGLREGAPPATSVQLHRLAASGASEDVGTAEPAPTELPAWLELRRELDIGIPWMVHNELVRLGPGGQSVLVRVPLLPGERVTTPGIEVQGLEATVQIGRDEQGRQWSSTLDETERLLLAAPTDRPWMERWTLDCSPVWRCGTEGLAPTRHMDGGQWKPEWSPWPGEQLTLAFARPAPAEGESVTLDAVRLRVEPGRRIDSAVATLEIRASQASDHRLKLPPGGEVQVFSVDGQPRPFEVRDGSLLFATDPGAHTVQVTWQAASVEGLLWRAPLLDVGRAAANVDVEVRVPEHRWLLWAWGTRWGPVVTFWQHLAVLLLAAAALGRWAPTPLRTLEWALLGLGLSQTPLAAAVIVGGWLIALAFRGRWLALGPVAHNLLQLTLVGWTLVALAMLVWGIYEGLIVEPDMQVEGMGSSGRDLHWYADHHDGALPQPGILWLPLWAYRVLMLAWSLWLARALLRWLSWGFRQWTAGGWWRVIQLGGASRPTSSPPPSRPDPAAAATPVPTAAPEPAPPSVAAAPLATPPFPQGSEDPDDPTGLPPER